MQLFENKVFTRSSIVILAVTALWVWYTRPVNSISRVELLAWIETGYTAQFCSVIYPHFADCVTVTKDSCAGLVAVTLNPCLEELAGSLPDKIEPADKQKYYTQAGACFEANIHAELLQNHLIDSPECRQKLS